MAEEGPRILDYRGPPTEPVEGPSFWRSKRLFYCVGLGIGGYAAMVASDISGPHEGGLADVFIVGVIGAALSIILALPAYLVHGIATIKSPDTDARTSMALGPVAALAFFPAAHLLCCKVFALATGDFNYPGHISPAHFLAAWLAFGAICTLLVRSAPRLGKKKRHWVFAGIAAAPFLTATMDGVEYLHWSATGSANDVYWFATSLYLFPVLAFACFALPVVVVMSYQLMPDLV